MVQVCSSDAGKPVLGVLPYLHGLHLEAENALPGNHLSHSGPLPLAGEGATRFRVVVAVLPRISNHTDFDVLRLHPQVDFRFVGIDDGIDTKPPPAWGGLLGRAALDIQALLEVAIDRLADAVEGHLDLPRLLSILGFSTERSC